MSDITEKPDSAMGKIAASIEKLVCDIPSTCEPKAENPAARSRQIANAAAAKAALISGGMALPGGLMGVMTVLPDIMMIWRVQSQMVADIAGAYGKEAWLTREQMLYCLFKHAASQALRDLVVRSGERIAVKALASTAMRKILKTVGARIGERLVGRTLFKWLPIVGAVGVGAYAYYDTAQVAKTAEDFFKKDIAPGA